MSDPLRVALVVEGPTDRVVIEAVITELLDGGDYVTTTLQPEGSDAFGPRGGGWGGVFRWCREAAESGGDSLRGEVLFENHDLLVIHLDADVAGKRYADYGFLNGFHDLPCQEPCPPARGTADALRRVLLNWAGETHVPPRTVLCIPSKSMEAWVLAALFPNDQVVLSGVLECHESPESRFGQQPVARRVRKTEASYRGRAKQIQRAWQTVTDLCGEARRFSDDFTAVLATVANSRSTAQEGESGQA